MSAHNRESLFPTRRIYVASSWRNEYQPTTVAALRGLGHEVYDFRKHFDWALCDPDAPIGTTYREGVGFGSLVEALRDLTANEAEHTPDGFYPSGNIALYWSRKVRA